MQEQAKPDMNEDVKNKIEKIDQATMLIIDVGQKAATSEVINQKSFFESAREFAVGLIERKIFSQGKHWVGVILLGSENNDNSVAEKCERANKHIYLLHKLGPPTWKMIREIPEQPSNSEADWIDALSMADEHFKSKSNAKIADKLVVLVTNFQTPTNNQPEAIQAILDRFQKDKYKVDIISPNLEESMLKGYDLDVARQFVKNTNGGTANFECAMQNLMIHRKKTPRPWNVDLSIGPNLKIPVSAYTRVKDEPIVKNWVRSVKDPVTGTSSAKESFNKSTVYFNPENQSVVDNDDIIRGYYCGQDVIPVSDPDKKMFYESGNKCLSVYGFTNKLDVKWQNLNGDGLMYIFGRKGDKNAQDAIRCLVECLQETESVAIVRQVYNNNNAPKMCALFPVVDTDNYFCLSMAAVCFKEDIKYMYFPFTNPERYTPDEAQVSAFKDLIKAMDLTKAYDDESNDDEEAFPVAQTVSPYAQYVRDCIAFRALNPNKPLPKPREEILSLFKVPPTVAEKAKAPLEKLKSILILNKVEKKQRKDKIILNDDPMIDSSINAPNNIDQN